MGVRLPGIGEGLCRTFEMEHRRAYGQEDVMSQGTEPDGVPEWDDVEDDGVLDGTDTLEDDVDPLDTGVAAADRWAGANRFGTTPAEARQGEPLDRRLAQEEPDVDPLAAESDDEDETTRRGYDREQRAGRLVADDESFGADGTTDAIGWDVGIDAGAASAEEAAMHIVMDPDGVGDGPLR
jgi:hypothetical protein